MNLLLPLGLIGLIAIPLILLIHIIKPKYHERTISSTYIWQLAKKYRKRKIPFEKLTQFFLIGLQFLIVIAISFLLTKPFVKTPDKIVNDQIIMIDCSASMNTLGKDGKTRYNKAADDIVNSFSKFSDESKFSLIFVDDTPTVGNVINSSNRTELEFALREDGKCTYSNVTQSDYDSAIEQVKGVLKQNKNADVTIYTDHKMSVTGNVNVVNVAEGEWNVALMNNDISLNSSEGYYQFKTNVVSYNQDKDVVLELSVKDPYSNNTNLKMSGNRYYEYRTLHLKKNNKVEVSFDELSIYQFSEASFKIKEKQESKDLIQDSFISDNEFYAFNGNDAKFKVQLISESRTFVSAALNVLGTCDEIVVSKSLQYAKSSGFDLYIYDTIGPTNLPEDGSVWIINPMENQSYANGTFKTGNNIQSNHKIRINKDLKHKHSDLISSHIKDNAFYVNKRVGINSYDETIYDSCITTENGAPLVLAGKVGLTNVCIMSFDLHYSNLPTTFFMPILVNNMMDYSVKRIVAEHFYDVGETIEFNVNASINSIKLVHDSEQTVFGFESLSKGVEYKIKSPGVYTVISNPDAKNSKQYSFFAEIADDESNFSIKHTIALGEVTGVDGETKKVSNSNKDISFYFAIALLVLLVVEWGVQYREQY